MPMRARLNSFLRLLLRQAWWMGSHPLRGSSPEVRNRPLQPLALSPSLRAEEEAQNKSQSWLGWLPSPPLVKRYLSYVHRTCPSLIQILRRC